MATTPSQLAVADTSTATSPAPSSPPPSPRPSPPSLNASSSVRERPPDWRERRRQSEQRSRQKRKDIMESMPAQVAALERAAMVIRILPDPDVVWDEFVDEETKRMRASLRKLLPVIQEIKQLTSTKAQLQRLLREHQLAKRALAHLIVKKTKKDKKETRQQEVDALDDWAISVQRWRELTRLHFSPLTMDQCVVLMNDALLEMHRFTTSEDRLSSGMSFMGWCDSRRILPSQSSLQFVFNKTYRGCDLNRHMQMTWRLYTDQQLYLANILGGRGRVCVDILQELSPTAWVVRIDESYDGIPVHFHQLFLIFLVETPKGTVQYLTCINDGDLQQAISSPRDMWTANYYWFEWVELDATKDRSSTDFHLSVGGCLRAQDPSFLNRWLCEILAALVRSEGVVNNKPMLNFS